MYDARHDYDPEHVLYVEVTDDTGALRLIVLEDGRAATVELDANGVRALRLALTRYERRGAL
jgi:hypothetical protein